MINLIQATTDPTLISSDPQINRVRKGSTVWKVVWFLRCYHVRPVLIPPQGASVTLANVISVKKVRISGLGDILSALNCFNNFFYSCTVEADNNYIIHISRINQSIKTVDIRVPNFNTSQVIIVLKETLCTLLTR